MSNGPLIPTPAEQKLIDAAARGEIAEYSSTDPAQNDPKQGAAWGAERSLRAELVYALATDANSEWPVHAKGVWAKGAKIIGQLDFQAAKIPKPLGLLKCRTDKPIVFRDASAHSIYFNGSNLAEGLNGDGLRVEHGIFLDDGVMTKGEVRLLGAAVGGQLACAGALFENPLHIGPDGKAVAGTGWALALDGVSVKGGVFLNAGFTAKGEVRLLHAIVGGQLICEGASLENPPRICPDGKILPGTGRALNMDGIEVKGNVFLSGGFTAKGEVRLRGATLGGQFACEGASLENPSGDALSMDGADIKGDVLLTGGFKASGGVRLVGASLGGQLACEGASFKNPGNRALTLQNAAVTGPLMIRKDFRTEGKVDLANARLGTLADDEGMWPAKGQLDLDGLTYSSIHGPCEAKKRLEWLARQPKFHPQPYEQLARVLRQLGREHDAREILFAKHQRMRKEGGLSASGRFSNHFVELTVGYGYKWWRSFLWMLGLFLIGSIVAWVGWRSGVVVTASRSRHRVASPAFHATLYSLDQFSLPPLHFGQQGDWQPVARSRYDPRFWAFQIYFIFHALAGWTLTGLLIAALTGIIKKET